MSAPSASRYARWLGAIAWLIVFQQAPVARAQDTPIAYAVRAAYLYKFAPFIAWPNPSAEYPDGAFTICIAGGDEFGELLSRLVRGQAVGGHPIAVRQLDAVTSSPDCSELYLRGPPEQVARDLAAVRGAPVLTVTNGAREPAATGMINFVLKDGHVRFAIDNVAATAAGLAISSKLLSLAVQVTEQRR